MVKYILNLIYPSKCMFCKTILVKNNIRYEYICKDCHDKLPFISDQSVSIIHRNKENNLSRNYYFDDCISSFYYKDMIARSICNFKFNNKKLYAIPFSCYLGYTIKRFYRDINFDFVTYIPMYRSKESKRTYNQSKLLASKLSKILKIPLKNVLIKTKDNETQHSLSMKLREINVKDVYEISCKLNVNYQNVLLIDDIVTTGNTLNEATKQLKQFGIKHVYCATLATPMVKNKYSLSNKFMEI